jgi:hypothetical protein
MLLLPSSSTKTTSPHDLIVLPLFSRGSAIEDCIAVRSKVRILSALKAFQKNFSSAGKIRIIPKKLNAVILQDFFRFGIIYFLKVHNLLDVYCICLLF